jgi:hypothetical protein
MAARPVTTAAAPFARLGWGSCEGVCPLATASILPLVRELEKS